MGLKDFFNSDGLYFGMGNRLNELFKNNVRHKVFVSYHHDNDEYYRDKFDELTDKLSSLNLSKKMIYILFCRPKPLDKK